MSAELFKGCFAYYKLDETSGVTAVDSTSFHNDGQIGTSTIGQAGKINTCYSFNNQVGVACQGESFNLCDYYNFTISWWEYRTELQDTSTSIHIPGVAIIGYSEYQTNFCIYIHKQGGGYITNLNPWRPYNGTPITNRWVHYVFVKNGDNYIFYVDGENTKSMGAAGYIAIVSNPTLYIGGSSTYQTFKGLIDEVGFWSRSLSSSEVAELYNNGDGTAYVPYKEDTHVYDNCFAYYKLNSLDDGIAVDSTSNGIDLNRFSSSGTNFINYTSSGKINGGISCTYNASNGSVLSTKQSLNDHWAGITDPTKIEKIVSENKTYTISAWAYINTTYNYDQIVASLFLTNGSATGIEQINISYNTVDLGGKWCCWTDVHQPSWSTTPAISGYTSQWAHLVAIVDPNYITLYINGNLIKSQQRNGTNSYNISDIKGVILNVGNNEWLNRRFDGYIDEVGFWNKGLSASEIQTLYNGGAGLPFESGPTYLVELTDGVGVTDDVETQTNYHVELQDYNYTTDSEDINQDTKISLRDNVSIGDNVKVKVDYKVNVQDGIESNDDQRVIVYKNGIDSIWTDRQKPTDTMWVNRPKPWIRN